MLRTDKEAREYLGGKFRYVMVDEFQDTNEVQFEIVRLLSSVHGNLFAVGDDDQSIYGWRGARIENILQFEKQFPSAPGIQIAAQLPLHEKHSRRGERNHQKQRQAQTENFVDG